MDSNEKQKLISQHGMESLITMLAPYVSDERKQRVFEVISARLSSIELAIDNPYDIHNALAAVRSAECFGISTIHIIAPNNESVGIKPVTKGAFNWVNIIIHNNLKYFLEYCKKRKLDLYGGALQQTSIGVAEIPIEKPLCIFIGNEHHGLSASAKQACKALFKIPLHGMSESLNLSVSAAISLFDITNRKRKQLKRNSDLSAEKATNLKAEYYITSVSERLLYGLLKRKKAEQR